jgi:SpoIID/LytB domain protein
LVVVALGIFSVRRLTQIGPDDLPLSPVLLDSPLPDFSRISLAWTGTLAVSCAFSVLVNQAPVYGQAPSNPILDVGVVQRFGNEPQNQVVLKPPAGDNLTLKFQVDQQPQTLTTTGEVKLQVEMQPLPQPKITERVILSTHRSFESAEDSATQWQSQGIEVEVAQPKQWQVWAKRDTYKTPLLRRLLMQNLQSNGSRTAFIDTQVQQQQPKAAITINGTRYQQDEMEFATGTNQVEVSFNRDDHGTRLYGGSLKFQPNAYGTYTLVNQVPLETYLRGVVPHEIGSGAPPTTIEAQAVLARTYVLRNLRRFAIDNYQICADTQCQVYWGLNGAVAASDRAIAATRGMVLTYNNELVDALYSSTTGGITAPFSNVWNGPDRPYLRAVVDSVQNVWDLPQRSLADEANFRDFINLKQGFNEEGWDMFRWRVESPLTDIARDLRAYLQSKQHPLANFTQVKEVKVTERSPAGRVQKMVITTNRGDVELEKDEIIRALYAPNSLLFYLDPVYETPKPSPSPSVSPQANSPSSQTSQVSTQPGSQPSSQPSSQANATQTSPVAQAQGSPANGATVTPGSTAGASPTAAKVLKGYRFVGGGLGHGVGMSQTGAYRLGKLGWTNDRILSFYYPGTQLQPLTPAITFWRTPEPEPAAATASD